MWFAHTNEPAGFIICYTHTHTYAYIYTPCDFLCRQLPQWACQSTRPWLERQQALELCVGKDMRCKRRKNMRAARDTGAQMSSRCTQGGKAARLTRRHRRKRLGGRLWDGCCVDEAACWAQGLVYYQGKADKMSITPTPSKPSRLLNYCR